VIDGDLTDLAGVVSEFAELASKKAEVFSKLA